MFNEKRASQFHEYSKAWNHFSKNPQTLIDLEKHISEIIVSEINSNKAQIKNNYNEASYLFPFWQNYPPEERGRQPKGDQYPWIEVGEHAVGSMVEQLLSKHFSVNDIGIPSGADQRYLIKSNSIAKLTNGFTDSCWLFIDIKSVGPRDDADHTVLSPNQVSGDGIWAEEAVGLKNSVLKATGKRASHDFHCTMPPIFILSNGTIAPVVIMVIKPVYKMLSLITNGKKTGQPIDRIDTVTIPNGLLLTHNPNYLGKYPKLLFPGKDDKSKNPIKLRARIDFKILRNINPWRHEKTIFT